MNSMQIQFVGVGEAFDENIPNNSHIVQWGETRLLVDCGYFVPPVLWKLHPDADFVDAVYISHGHADHYFGLPAYFLRLAEERRTRDVEIICGEGLRQKILDALELAFPGLISKYAYGLKFHEVAPGSAFDFRGARMQFAVTSHPVRNLAIAVEAEGRTYAYSGDGDYTEHSRRLYRGANLLVHESYAFEQPLKGHAAISRVIEMARAESVGKLALTHIQRELRRDRKREIQAMISQSGLDVVVPEPGETLKI